MSDVPVSYILTSTISALLIVCVVWRQMKLDPRVAKCLQCAVYVQVAVNAIRVYFKMEGVHVLY